jgi:hypothetical protein
MWITTDQAAEMYARFCCARYGEKASAVVTSEIAKLRQRGDAEGERVWGQVKRAIEQSASERRVAA